MAQERSGFYTSIEDAYYGFCDYLQQNLKIPIYDSFVTPIESRGIPSFPAFIGILLIIAITAIFIFSNQAGSATTTLKVNVAQSGIPLDGALVSLQIDGKEFKALKTNSEGIVEFANVPIGKSATLKIDKEGYVSDEKTITISKEQEDLTFSLSSKSVKEEKISITLKVKDSDGVPIDSALVSYFDSETGNFETTSTDASGSAVLFAQNSKSELSLTVSKNNYVEEQVSIFAENERTKTATLRKKAVVPIDDGGKLTGTGEVLVYVVDSKGMPVDANVHLHLFSTNAEIGFSRTFDSGKATFENVDAVGAKIYVVAEPRKSDLLQTYDGSGDAQILTSKDPLEFNVVLEKTTSRDKNITLLVSDKQGAAIAQVSVKIYNQDTGIPLSTKTTNADGKIAFSTDKLVYATFSKEGYLPTYELDLIAGDDRSIVLQKISDDSVGSVNVKVIDFDGELVQGAKVNLMTQEGYFAGIKEAISMEDGIAKFENVPIELLGDEAKYIAKGNFESVSGSSSMFLPQVNEVVEIPLKLNQAKGTAIISLKDATNGKPINSGKASAYLRMDDSKIIDCNDFSSGTCTIDIPANKLIYFKISSQNFVDYESEDFFVEPLEKKNFEGALIPSALKDELAVYFEGVSALDGNGVFSRNPSTLTKGNYYNAKFVLNIPSNSEKAGIFIKASSRDAVEAESDIVYIDSYSKPENAIITKGFAFRPSDNCKLDSGINEEADDKPVKWLNYEYRKQQSSKAIIVKVFVKPLAKTTDEIAFDYRGYSAIGKVFARTPEDSAFGRNERTDAKDWCYAAANKTKFTVIEDRFKCNDNACTSLLFENANGQKVSKGFSVDVGSKFASFVSIRALSAIGNSAYLKITTQPELKIFEFNVGETTGNAQGKNSQLISLDDMQAGKLLQGKISMQGIIPAGYSKIDLEIGNADGVLQSFGAYITVSGTNNMVMAASPLLIEANDESKIKVSLTNAIDGSQITDAVVSIEETDGNVFDGAVPYEIVGENAKDAGEDGVYAFNRLHPYNTGKFKIVAKREGFRDAEKEVVVKLNEFLSASSKSLILSCDGNTIDVANLLDAKITVKAQSACLEILGDGVTNLEQRGMNVNFDLLAKKSKSLILNPLKQGNVCDLNIDAEATGGAHANLKISSKVTCPSLEKFCATDAQCGSGFVCTENSCVKENVVVPYADLPDPIVIDLDENYGFVSDYSLVKVAQGSTVTGCEIKSPETDEIQKMQTYVSVDCATHANILTLTADYSTHPKYTQPAIPTYDPNSAMQVQAASKLEFADEKASKISFAEEVSPSPTAPVLQMEPIHIGRLYITFANRAQKTVVIKVNGPKSPFAQVGGSGVVYITPTGFNPIRVNIPENGKVIWVNADKVARSVKQSSFNSPNILPGKPYEHVFDKTGIYNYYDGTRTATKGVIEVGNLDKVCRYKNANYFAQRFIGHLARSAVSFFNPSDGKSQQIAYSSVYKFFVRPNGVTAAIQPGLAMPQVYGNGFNPMTQAYSPNDQVTQSEQLFREQFGGSGTLAGAYHQGICEVKGAGFDCNVVITPLLPTNGMAFTIVNDYALYSASPDQLLIKGTLNEKDIRYLRAVQVDKIGVDGFINGKLTAINDLVANAPRYATFILMNKPSMIEYYMKDGYLAIRFKEHAGDTLDQKINVAFPNRNQAFTITVHFTIDNKIGKFALINVPSEAPIARVGTNGAKEPSFLVNNVPSANLANANLEQGGLGLENIYYYEQNKAQKEIESITLGRGDKIKADTIALPIPPIDAKAKVSDFDVVGNPLTGEFKNDDPLYCSKDGFCTFDDGANTLKKFSAEIGELQKPVIVQRIDFAGFGDYAARRFAEAFSLTMKDYLADKAQFELCKGIDAITGGICRQGGPVQDPTDYNCYKGGEYCDNSVSGGELWAITKEQFGRAACDSEVVNNLQAAFAGQGNFDLVKAKIMQKLLGDPAYMPRIQYTKPIVGTDNFKISVILKRAADGSESGYVVDSVKLFDKSENGLGQEGFFPLLDLTKSDDEQINTQKTATPISTIAPLIPIKPPSGALDLLRIAGKNQPPSYFYTELDGSNYGIKFDSPGKPNLFTMNKYPFNFADDKLKANVFDDAELKKLIISDKEADPRAIKVESCYFGVMSQDMESNMVLNNMFTDANKCKVDVIDAITIEKMKTNEIPSKIIMKYDEAKKENKLMIAIGKEYNACKMQVNPVSGSDQCILDANVPKIDYSDSSKKLVRAALKVLFDEAMETTSTSINNAAVNLVRKPQDVSANSWDVFMQRIASGNPNTQG